MFAVPTVRVVSAATADGYVIINESDLCEDHVLWGEDKPAAPPEVTVVHPLRTAKGPGGRWYVMRDRERIGSGYATEAEAETERARLAA